MFLWARKTKRSKQYNIGWGQHMSKQYNIGWGQPVSKQYNIGWGQHMSKQYNQYWLRSTCAYVSICWPILLTLIPLFINSKRAKGAGASRGFPSYLISTNMGRRAGALKGLLMVNITTHWGNGLAFQRDC